MNAVRDRTPADGPGIDALLDENPDPLWANQGHRMHGAPRECERWRRTWVAEENDAVVGAVTLVAIGYIRIGIPAWSRSHRRSGSVDSAGESSSTRDPLVQSHAR